MDAPTYRSLANRLADLAVSEAQVDRGDGLRRVTLTEEDSRRFLEALQCPGGPNAALQQLMTGYDPASEE